MNTNKKRKILIRPLITEKSVQMADTLNKYTFIVDRNASKIEIAKAVESKFNVTSKKVHSSNVLGKKVVWGKKRIPSNRSNFKKAVVTLKKGDKISIFEIK